VLFVRAHVLAELRGGLEVCRWTAGYKCGDKNTSH